mgnify:CR=1 FL=1
MHLPSRHISNENGGNLNLKGDRYKEWATTLEDSETHLAWYPLHSNVIHALIVHTHTKWKMQ